MTLSISASLQTHLADRRSTLCTCWKVTRRDGEIFTFTDCRRDLVVDALTYIASSGYSASAIQTNAALNVDNLEIQGALSDESITETDMLAGLWDFAEIEIFMVNYEDLTMGKMNLRKGNLGELRLERNTFVAELRGLMQRLQQATGYIVSPACNANLGDARCGVNLALFTSAGTITSLVSRRLFTASALAQATDYFKGGKITFDVGTDNEGLSMEVKNFTSGGIIELHQPMPFTVTIGDTFTIHAGCDKSIETCLAKFNNVVNFRGFPHVPGMEKIAGGK